MLNRCAKPKVHARIVAPLLASAMGGLLSLASLATSAAVDQRFRFEVRRSQPTLRLLLAAGILSLLSGCTETGGEPMKTVDQVDLERFMGDWYVVANIPTFVEKGAHNAVESYALNPDGTIATTFTFNKDAFDGPQKVHHPKGFVLDTTTNAHWGMQFIWPIKADFRIIYLDDDYQNTVIGRAKRDYVWVMSRTPDFSDAEFEEMKAFIESVGYDPSKLQPVPQQAG